MDTLLYNKWNLWYHHDKDNWAISGYKKIYEMRNIKEFWIGYFHLPDNATEEEIAERKVELQKKNGQFKDNQQTKH